MAETAPAAASARSAWRKPHVHITELQNPAQAMSGPVYTTNACFCGGALEPTPSPCCQPDGSCCNMAACVQC